MLHAKAVGLPTPQKHPLGGLRAERCTSLTLEAGLIHADDGQALLKALACTIGWADCPALESPVAIHAAHEMLVILGPAIASQGACGHVWMSRCSTAGLSSWRCQQLPPSPLPSAVLADALHQETAAMVRQLHGLYSLGKSSDNKWSPRRSSMQKTKNGSALAAEPAAVRSQEQPPSSHMIHPLLASHNERRPWQQQEDVMLLSMLQLQQS